MFDKTQLNGFHQSEFEKNDLTVAIERYLGPCGRLLSGSKGQYRADNSHQRVTFEPLVGSLEYKKIETCPKNIIIFNANLVTKDGRKVWYGDLDLTVDEDKLRRAAKNLGVELNVLSEHDARFNTAEKPRLEDFIYWTDGDAIATNADKKWVDGRLEFLPDFGDESKQEIAQEYNESDFEVFKLKIEDLDQDDEDYEFNNYLEVRKFFDGLSEKNSPIHNFQNFLLKEQGVKPEDYTKIYVSKEVADKLEAYMKIWYEVYHGEFETDYRKQSNFNWIWFDVSPSYFRQTPEWAVEDKLYVRKKS